MCVDFAFLVASAGVIASVSAAADLNQPIALVSGTSHAVEASETRLLKSARFYEDEDEEWGGVDGHHGHTEKAAHHLHVS
jgi:hypothetical protein